MKINRYTVITIFLVSTQQVIFFPKKHYTLTDNKLYLNMEFLTLIFSDYRSAHDGNGRQVHENI